MGLACAVGLEHLAATAVVAVAAHKGAGASSPCGRGLENKRLCRATKMISLHAFLGGPKPKQPGQRDGNSTSRRRGRTWKLDPMLDRPNVTN
jgi:hypothetical protein